MTRARLGMLFGVLAVLLCVGLAPGRLDASADASGTADGATVTTTLYPGWNMAGWVGPTTPVMDLFETIPELLQILAWDTEAGRYLRSTRTSIGHGMSQLARGSGLWLQVGGEAPIEWTRTVSDEYVLLSLREGWNLVGWTGEDGTAPGDAFARLGDAFAGAARWDADAGRYAAYYPDAAQPVDSLKALSRGDALWVRVLRDARWAHPGTGRVVFEFADGISPELRGDIREEMANVMAFFGERLGVYHDDLRVSVPYTAGCWSGPGFIKLTHPWCTAHEYFHAIQSALAKGRPLGPMWLLEGSATYGEETYNDVWSSGGGLEYRWLVAPSAAAHVASIRNPESAPQSRLNYHLGFIAADWLVDQAGEASLLDYYRLLPASDSWEEAFATAFGLSIDEFYDGFEAYRAEVAPPLPHLTDEVVKPIAVFYGDIPEETRASIEGELDAVYTFLTERFGAEPAEYSVYVGSDWKATAHHAYRLWWNRWWDDRVRRLSLSLTWEPGCTVDLTGWLVHALDCEHPLDHQSYINSHIRALLVDKEQRGLSPMWIEAGGAAYLGLIYRVGGTSAFDDELARYVSVAQQSQVSLQELAPDDSIASKGPWENGDSEENAALSLLAVDWLLRRAGERALFEYFRLLPNEVLFQEPTGWQGAFEEAFGLTADDFYEQFETYRATLAAPQPQ